ncbi:hypothetical protein DPX16_23605 [Anabarilius grahami]|uniref:Uncharacterized protein n=1 Tax=Anabarilius grahami TaxID=495550 RepID=A0A3N0ZC80_ANAGA|nr:hypothetical protein DPX16_23605 [Anabarilius grahami]
MQSTASTSGDRPFAELVNAVCQSLLPTTPSSSSAASAGPMTRPATFTSEVRQRIATGSFNNAHYILTCSPISSPPEHE